MVTGEEGRAPGRGETSGGPLPGAALPGVGVRPLSAPVLLLRLVGAGVLAYFLATGLDPDKVSRLVTALLVVCVICLVLWLTVGRRVPDPAFAVLVAAPTLISAYLAAGEVPLAIIVAFLGISMLTARISVPAWWGLTLGGLALVALEVGNLTNQNSLSVVLTSTGTLAVGALLGFSRRQSAERDVAQRRLAAQRDELLAQALAMQEERARTATLLERGRIARDIHDVLAHSLGGLVVQLDAAEALLTVKGDVDGAAARLRRSRDLAVEGLDEARRAVQALRSGGERPGLREGIEALAVGFEAEDIAVRATGEPRELPAEVEDVLLAVTREACTNIRKHAPGASAAVVLAFLPEAFELTIRQAAVATAAAGTPLGDTGAGVGLRGMRERVERIAGDFEAGPTDDGGWLVRVRVADGGAGWKP